MKRYIRLLALLVLAMFLPTTIAVSAPLVWCVSDDGHSALENKSLSGLHGLHDHEPGQELAFAALLDNKQEPYCDDQALQVASSATKQTAKAAEARAKDERSLSPLFANKGFWSQTQGHFRFAFVRGFRFAPSAQLEQLRTVILLT